MMKKTVILIVLVGILGAVTFVFIQLLLTPAPGAAKDDSQTDYTASTTYTPENLSTSTVSTSTSSGNATQLQQTANTDGPFTLIDTHEGTTSATVRFVRSPEEVLLQFDNFSGTYATDSHLYLATGLHVSDHIDLGSVKLADGVHIYDVPLDFDQNAYPYIVIYDVENSKVLYYAHIQ